MFIDLSMKTMKISAPTNSNDFTVDEFVLIYWSHLYLAEVAFLQIC
jgi:hypothetical protein